MYHGLHTNETNRHSSAYITKLVPILRSKHAGIYILKMIIKCYCKQKYERYISVFEYRLETITFPCLHLTI